MAESTGIEWTDATWSPWEGCTRVGPGCDHCYAESMNRWLRRGENWGPGAPRRFYSEDHWTKPIKWQRDALKFDTLHQRRRRVFPSVCDPFDNEASDFLRQRFFGLIRLTPSIDWLLLTKRIGNAKSMLPADWGDGYPNVWIGATVVNQEEADRDIPKLLALPASVRFLSCEPLLEPIALQWNWLDGIGSKTGERLHWVIAGGESGPKARDCDIGWIRSIVAQCKSAGTPVLVKQLGAKPVWSDTDDDSEPPHWGRIIYNDKKGGDWSEWPHALRVREFPDGVQHDGYPT